MAGIGVEEAGVAGMYPPVRSLALRSLLRIFVITHEHAGRPEQHFARIRNFHIDVDIRLAHGVGIDFAIGLGGDVDRGFRLPVKLLEIDAQRAPEAENLRADRLAGRIGETHARHAETVFQRAVDQEVAKPIEQARMTGTLSLLRIFSPQRRANAMK